MTRTNMVSTFIALVVLLAGCGSGHKSLTGKVTFSDDDSPLTIGTVNFVNGAFQARAPLQPDGTYTVGTFKADDGLPPGKYKVFIAGAVKVIAETRPGRGQEVTTTAAKGMPITMPFIHPKYASAETSGLEIEVDSNKSADFKVDRFAKK